MRSSEKGRSNFVKAPDTCMKWSRDFRDAGSPNSHRSKSGSLRFSLRIGRNRECRGQSDRTCRLEWRTGAPKFEEHRHHGEASGIWNFE